MLINSINSLFLIDNIYEQTTIILSAETLIMGVTLLIISYSLKHCSERSKSGLIFLAIAMLALCIINLAEYIVGVEAKNELYSLSVVVFAASMEVFLFFMAYMSMLYKGFVNKRRICIELGCIVLFTTPAMFICPDNYPLLFNLLFAIGIVFYTVKLVFNFFVYRKQIKIGRELIVNVLSDDSSQLLKWINNTFYITMVIGVISIVVPMTNLTVLVFYNTFLFFSFFYIYISVILNISIFDKGISILEEDESEIVDETSSLSGAYSKQTSSIMSDRQKFLDDWIAARGYSVAGITATEVSLQLKISRTKLSQYLKNELNTTYYEWIASLRIEDAKRQLIEYSNRSIYEIALNVGIEDRDNFRRVFQRYVGMSPSAYRKEHLK